MTAGARPTGMLTRQRICAVIPAAGRGTRLNAGVPKILARIDGCRTVWTILRDTLRAARLDRIHVILSPAGASLFNASLSNPNDAGITASIQAEPRGMGEAIFSAEPFWRDAETIVVVWGDQVHVSGATLTGALEAHCARPGPRATIPLVCLPTPYVQYDFDGAGRLVNIRQSREGDGVDARGLSDVGTFALDTAGLRDAWTEYLSAAPAGRRTGEINFLPFLTFLSRQKGWPVDRFDVEDPLEARGVNTPADLEFFRERYAVLS